MISPNVGRRTFQLATILAPFALMLLLELQQQIDDRQFDWWTLSSVATGALMSLVVAVFNVQRAGTEQAESNAEVRTGTDQDADSRVEQPEGEEE